MFKLRSTTLKETFNQALSKLVSFAMVLSLFLVTTVNAQASGLIPCDGDDCNIVSVFQLINNIINFFFKTLLIPIFVVMILYLGYGYLTAGGNSSQHAKLKSMAKHMILGLLLMLGAWLIVKTILLILGYNDPFGFLS